MTTWDIVAVVDSHTWHSFERRILISFFAPYSWYAGIIQNEHFCFQKYSNILKQLMLIIMSSYLITVCS